MSSSQYIRLGAGPSGNSRNHRDGTAECGVSVYRAIWAEDGVTVDLTESRDPVSAVMILASARQWYAVDGDEVGRGSDGEPLLDRHSVKARKVSPDFDILFRDGSRASGGETERAMALAIRNR